METDFAREVKGMKSGLKRSADWDPGLPFPKRPRLAVVPGEGDVGSSGSAGISNCNPGVIVNVPAEAVAAFDFSVLTGALQSESFIEEQVSDDESVPDVFVPGVARPVVIPKQVIAKEISRRLQLQVHDFGVFDEPEGGLRGWIEMDVPSEVGGPNVKQKFFGDHALSRYDAMESASEDLIRGMCRRSGVIIKDINYEEVKKLEWKLSAERDWADLFRDKLDQRTNEVKAVCDGYANLIADAKKICQKFKDVLPIETIGEEDLLLGMDDVKVLYNGPRQPASDMDHLAFDLVSLANKNTDLKSMVSQMKRPGHEASKRKVYRRF